MNPQPAPRLPLAALPPLRARGVVLVEVVAALTIFAIAVLGLAKALGAATRHAGEARLVLSATRGMENALEEAIHRPKIEPGEWTSEPDAHGMIYTTTIREAELNNQDGQLLDGLFEVEVRGVLPGGPGRDDQTWILRTLCFPPLHAGSL